MKRNDRPVLSHFFLLKKLFSGVNIFFCATGKILGKLPQMSFLVSLGRFPLLLLFLNLTFTF